MTLDFYSGVIFTFIMTKIFFAQTWIYGKIPYDTKEKKEII